MSSGVDRRAEDLEAAERSRLDRVGKLEREKADQEGRRERAFSPPYNHDAEGRAVHPERMQT